MGDQPSPLRVVSDDPLCRRGRPFLQAAGPRGGPVLFDQDDDRADLLAGRHDRRHDAAGHRPDREETAGNAVALLPEERNQARRLDDLCQRSRQYAEGGDPGHLVSGPQEGRRHKGDTAARHSRTELQRRVRRRLWHHLRVHGRRVHAPRVARLCRTNSHTDIDHQECREGATDRSPGPEILSRIRHPSAGRAGCQS